MMRGTITYWRSRHILPRILLAAMVAAAGLWTGGYLLASKSTNGCDAALNVRDAIQDVLEDAQLRTQRTPPQTASERQRRQAAEFYERSIARLQRVTC